MKKKNILNNTLTIIFIILLFLFILTFSIGLPIHFRPFYYLQIKALHIEQESGYTYNEIRTAYDNVLNFLTIGTPYSTSPIDSLEGGNAPGHFADCKVLFDLDTWVMIISLIGVYVLIILDRKEIIELKKFFRFPSYFYTGIVALVIPSILIGLCAIDFDKAFVIFHSIFFPGKTDWWFDPQYDPIILIMPENFFMNCGILIGVSLICMSLCLIIIGVIKRTKKVDIN